MEERFRFCQKAFIRKDDKVLILKTSRNDPSPGKWEVAGGAVEFGEDLDKSLKREVEEETGLVFEKGKYICVVSSIYSYMGKVFNGISVFYECEYLDGEVRLSSEHIEHKWIKPSEYVNFDVIEVFKVAFEKYLEKI